MKRPLLLLFALVLASPALADQPPLPPQDQQQLPPPLPPQELQKQPLPAQGPQLQPPQQNAQPQAAAQPNNAAQPKKPGKPPEFFKARREMLAARKQARIDRMRQFQADRAAAEEKLYQDWHDRYIADAPVRAAYYNNLSGNLLAEAALIRERTAAYYYLSTPVFVPVVPIYPYPYPYTYSAPIYGQFIWTW